mmetsp:Transcript_27880/g.62222  ORF Transcript_27880/g.62222 Transcript_27880/m.62222 type:complete len:261 (-) Transcript_27880:14-796(-)
MTPPDSQTASAPTMARSTSSMIEATAESGTMVTGIPARRSIAQCCSTPTRSSAAPPEHSVTTTEKFRPCSAAATRRAKTTLEVPCVRTLAPSRMKGAPSDAIRFRDSLEARTKLDPRLSRVDLQSSKFPGKSTKVRSTWRTKSSQAESRGSTLPRPKLCRIPGSVSTCTLRAPWAPTISSCRPIIVAAVEPSMVLRSALMATTGRDSSKCSLRRSCWKCPITGWGAPAGGCGGAGGRTGMDTARQTFPRLALARAPQMPR